MTFRPLVPLTRVAGGCLLLVLALAFGSLGEQVGASADEPSISSVGLSDGQTVSGLVYWEAEVTGAAVRVNFTIDGGSSWTDESPPFVFGGDTGLWDTSRYSNGPHRMILRALLDDGSVVVSDIDIIVFNPGVDGCLEQSPLPCSEGPTGDPLSDWVRTSFRIPNPTAMVWGPDERLYVLEMFGRIHALRLGAAKEVLEDEVVTILEDRLSLGITLDPASTADDVVLWVSHSSPTITHADADSGIVTRLSGPGFSQRWDAITGLPRSLGSHSTNAIHFGPDGRLYIDQGSNTSGGAPNELVTEFGDRPEQPLSAAILVADVLAPGFSGDCASGFDVVDLPQTCDVRTYATGIRNSYDFVFHSNGHLYATDNGFGAAGSIPPRAVPPCDGLGDPAPVAQGGHNPGVQQDLLLLVEQGGYYGHPNPARDECVFKDGTIQGVEPLAAYLSPLYELGDHRSATGIIEYHGDAMAGELRGDLLIANYSRDDDISRVRLSGDGRRVMAVSSLVGGFADPLALAQSPDGAIYVGEFAGGRVTVLTPVR